MASSSAASLRIDNLRETIAGLRRVNVELPKEIRDRAKAAGGRIVPDAQGYYRGHYRQRTGKHASRMRVLATLRGDVKIVAGGKKFPEMGGQEFGSDLWPQFKPKAQNLEGGTGRFLWRAAVEGMDEFTADVQDALIEILRKGGFTKAGFV